MALTDNPHIKYSRERVRVRLPDPNPKSVLVIETDLSLREDAPDYDAAAVKSLLAAAEEERNRRGLDEAIVVSSA